MIEGERKIHYIKGEKAIKPFKKEAGKDEKK